MLLSSIDIIDTWFLNKNGSRRFTYPVIGHLHNFIKKPLGLRKQVLWWWYLYVKVACVSEWHHLCRFWKEDLQTFCWKSYGHIYVYIHMRQTLFKDLTIQKDLFLWPLTQHLGIWTTYYMYQSTIVTFFLTSTRYIPRNLK